MITLQLQPYNRLYLLYIKSVVFGKKNLTSELITLKLFHAFCIHFRQKPYGRMEIPQASESNFASRHFKWFWGDTTRQWVIHCPFSFSWPFFFTSSANDQQLRSGQNRRRLTVKTHHTRHGRAGHMAAEQRDFTRCAHMNQETCMVMVFHV